MRVVVHLAGALPACASTHAAAGSTLPVFREFGDGTVACDARGFTDASEDAPYLRLLREAGDAAVPDLVVAEMPAGASALEIGASCGTSARADAAQCPPVFRVLSHAADPHGAQP